MLIMVDLRGYYIIYGPAYANRRADVLLSVLSCLKILFPQTVEKGASVFESSTEVFCCSRGKCNFAANARGHPLTLLFALLLGSAAILP